MSAWKKAAKINQKPHRERHQPESRKQLGFLEKHNDYVLRAKDHNDKRDKLQELRIKAQNRNPDEFRHHMINAKVVDGVHHENDEADVDTPEQVKLMKTQDLKYIKYKLAMEKKKIAKLRAQLHQTKLATTAKREHVYFVDDTKSVKNAPENVPTPLIAVKASVIRKKSKKIPNQTETTSNLDAYKELEKRVNRERELTIVAEKLQLRKHLKNRKQKAPKKVKVSSAAHAALYVWKYERKK